MGENRKKKFRFSEIEIFVGAISKRNSWILNGDGRNGKKMSDADGRRLLKKTSTVNSANSSTSERVCAARRVQTTGTKSETWIF